MMINKRIGDAFHVQLLSPSFLSFITFIPFLNIIILVLAVFNKSPHSFETSIFIFTSVQYCHLKGVVGWVKIFTYHLGFWPAHHNPFWVTHWVGQTTKHLDTICQHLVSDHRHLGCHS